MRDDRTRELAPHQIYLIVLGVGVAIFAGLCVLADCWRQFGWDDSEYRCVIDSIDGAWEQHDAAAYFANWAPDATRVEGRTARPDQYDTTLTKGQYEAVMGLRLPPLLLRQPVQVTCDAMTIDRSGDTATVRLMLTRTPAEVYFGQRPSATTGELFRLRRRNGVWQIVENRSWPIDNATKPGFPEFDAEHWESLDRRANEAKTLPEKATALADGLRIAEAYAVAKEYTERAGAKRADEWVRRGFMAVCVGDAADAKASFKRALELDPKAEMPDYALAAAGRAP